MPKSNGGSHIATRDEFLASFKGALKHEELYLEESGKTVLVWELTGPEQLAYKQALTNRQQRIPIGGKRGKQAREMVIESQFAEASLKLVAMALKDANGRIQYDPDDLLQIPASVFLQIEAVAKRLSRLDDEDLDEGKGDSGPSPDASRSSSSPSLPAGDPSASSSKG